MKKLFLLLITLCLCTSMQAQQKKGKCTEGEFRNKREAYLKEKAQLTDEEAALVLPLYFEMLEKKELNNKEPWKKIKATNISNASEEEYDEIIQSFIDVDEKNVALEREYYKRVKEVLSSKKIFQLLHADLKFNRHMLKIINQSDKK